MAIFSEKIIAVKFIDAGNTVIEVLYKDYDQTISYALEVNWENQDFLDLLNEYSLEDIESETIKINRKKPQNINKPFIQQVAIEKELSIFDFFDIFDFLEKRYDESLVFKMKTDIFRLRGITDLPKAKINKIKKSKDALELVYLLKLALK